MYFIFVRCNKNNIFFLSPCSVPKSHGPTYLVFYNVNKNAKVLVCVSLLSLTH
jgi:hypothetical protein